MKKIWMLPALFLTPLFVSGADIAAVDSYQTNFESFRVGGSYNQEKWRTDDWRFQSQSLPIVEIDGGKALAVTAKNGHHSRIYLTPRDSGGLIARFDFTPGNGMWSFIGFKAPEAKWDHFQAAVLFPPAAPGGKLSRLENGKGVAFPGVEFQADQPYRCEIAVRFTPDGGKWRLAVQEKAGSAGTAGAELFRSDWMPFAADTGDAVGVFEVRSVGWSKPQQERNGVLDNLEVFPDPAFPSLEVRSCRFGHLFSSGEKVGIRAKVTANDFALEAPVKLVVKDGYGKSVFEEERALSLTAGKAEEFVMEIPAENFTRYGLYTVQLLTGGELPAKSESTFGILPPMRAGADEDSFHSPFGAFLYPLDGRLYPEFGPDYMAQAVAQMHDLGIRWVRCNFHWHNVEKEPGVFDWGKMGELVDELYRQKMHAFVELVNTAPWASSSSSAAGGSVDTGREWQCVAPRDFSSWRNFCARAAERFRGRVKHYEIWNEPGAPRNGRSNGFWRDSSANFIEIIRQGAAGVHSIDPEAKIMVSGFRAVDMGRHFENFVERVLPHVIDEIDIISFHHWGSGSWSPKIYDLQRLMREYGRTLPYWDSEGPGAGHDPGCIKNFLWTWSMGAEKVFPFIFNLPRYPDRSLVNADYTPTPGAMTFATMARTLAGMTPEGQLNAGEGVRAFSFSDGGRRVVVAWSEIPGKTATATLSGLSGGVDHYGNPLGEVKKGSYFRNSIEVGNDPCFLTLDFDGLEPHAPETAP